MGKDGVLRRYALAMVRSGVDAATIRAQRLTRQGLATPIARVVGFETLFRRLQPVSTGALVRPGSPPRLVHRTRFDSEAAADTLRPTRRIVKGRFQGGGVGYVHASDLALYANAFRRPVSEMSVTQGQVYDALRDGGPLTSSLLKEETGLLKKQINPALQRLQEAFLLYEDQVDDNWERAWFEFSAEWPDVDLDDGTRERAAATVVTRFLEAFVFATEEQLCDWTQWPKKRVGTLIADLEATGRVAMTEVADLGTGWLRREDQRLRSASPQPTVFLLDSGDYLSRAHKSELDRRFGRTDVLHYLYAAGEFIGAVRGHWGFKPFDIDDVAMELPAAAARALRDEVLSLVLRAYPEARHHVLRYAGRRV